MVSLLFKLDCQYADLHTVHRQRNLETERATNKHYTFLCCQCIWGQVCKIFLAQKNLNNRYKNNNIAQHVLYQQVVFLISLCLYTYFFPMRYDDSIVTLFSKFNISFKVYSMTKMYFDMADMLLTWEYT